LRVLTVSNEFEAAGNLFKGLIPGDRLPFGIGPISLLGLGPLQGRMDPFPIVQYLKADMGPGTDFAFRHKRLLVSDNADSPATDHPYLDAAAAGAIQTGGGDPFLFGNPLRLCLRGTRRKGSGFSPASPHSHCQARKGRDL